jgi:hypothetical protein
MRERPECEPNGKIRFIYPYIILQTGKKYGSASMQINYNKN